MKLSAENLDRYTPITEQEQIARGVHYKRIPFRRCAGSGGSHALDATKALGSGRWRRPDRSILRSVSLP